MKILLIHQNFPGQYKHLAPALAERGHEVIALGINKPAHPSPGVRVILHRPPPPAADWFKEAPLEMRELHTKQIRGHAVAHLTLKLKQEGFVPDVVCAHSGWGEALFIKDVLPHTPLIAYAEYYYGTEGGDAYFDPEFSTSTLADRERLRLKNTHLLHSLAAADVAISPTRFQRDRHPDFLRQKIRVIHDGIDTECFVPNPLASVTLRKAGLTLTKNDEVITFVGRELEPYRGYHMFMRALPRLMQLRPHAQIIVVGGDGVSYGAAPPAGHTWKSMFLSEVAGQIDLKRLHFVGKVPHEVLTQLMQISSAHVYLTYPFVLSWSLIEAMSIGCLIVGSRTAPVEEVITHGENGLLVDFFNPEEIATTVANALEHRETFHALRTHARAQAVRDYDLRQRCLPEQIALVESFAANAPSR